MQVLIGDFRLGPNCGPLLVELEPMSKSDLPATPSAAPSAVSRRTVFAGAGALGALGAVAAATGLSRTVPAAAPVVTAAAKPLESGGYQLTDHVKQYYATARI
jgi:hypothetical protein